ncbi:MAG: PilZ domain-containing protein [Gammaproteobacteria bacterium]
MLEHRWNQRVEIDLAAEWLSHTEGIRWQAGRIRNLSSEGLFIASDHPLPEHGSLHLRFTLMTDQGAAEYDLTGIIMHCTRRGAGLFVDVSQPSARLALGDIARYSARTSTVRAIAKTPSRNGAASPTYARH